MNRNVLLYQIIFNQEDIAAGVKHGPVVTHIFFPSKQVLSEAFYSSNLPQQRLPEYKTRLYLGANRIELVYFSEEVLARYLDHPELYEIIDSLAGGDISSLSNASEDRFLYVRYGKCRLKSGNITITAIYKDLSSMGQYEQRYWHSFELDAPDIDKSDIHFQNFLTRTYDGDWVDFEDPIAKLREAVITLSNTHALFAKSDNVYIRLPVQQTYKSYCDAASELYKIVGPDNLSQTVMKRLLTKDFAVPVDDLRHDESKRPLSTMQLLELLEGKLGSLGLITKPLRELAKLRIAADHKVLKPESTTKSYSREFAKMCNELAQALSQFAKLLEMHRKAT